MKHQKNNEVYFSCTSKRTCKDSIVLSSGPSLKVRYITDDFDDKGYFRAEISIYDDNAGILFISALKQKIN